MNSVLSPTPPLLTLVSAAPPARRDEASGSIVTLTIVDPRRWESWIAVFEQAVAREQVWSIRTRKFITCAPQTAASIVACASATLRWRLAREHQEREALLGAADDEYRPRPFDRRAYAARLRAPEFDVRPYLELMLGDVGTRFAKAPSRATALTLVKRFLATVFNAPSYAGEQPPRRRATEALPAAWQPVIAAFERNIANPKTLNATLSDVRRVALLALKHEREDPALLPSRDILERWAAAAKLPNYVLGHFFSHWRRLHEWLLEEKSPLATQLPEYPILIESGACGLNVEPLVDALIGEVVLAPRREIGERETHTGSEEDVPPQRFRARDLSTLEILDRIAPGFAQTLRRWLHGHGASLRPRTREAVTSAVDRVVAELVRMGFASRLASPQFVPLTLYEELVIAEPTGQQPDAMVPSDDLEIAVLGSAPVVPQVPLLQQVLIVMSRRPKRMSPTARRLGAEVAFFNQRLLHDLKDLWALTRRVFEPIILERGKDPARWTRVKTAHNASLAFVRAERARVQANLLCKNIDRLVEHITLPLLVCVGIPHLRAWVLLLRQRYEKALAAAAAAGVAPEEFWEVRQTGPTYLKWLERYIALAIITADPIRLKNLRFARIGLLGSGREIEIDLRTDLVTGREWIAGVHTTFTGTGGSNPAASLKKSRRAGREQHTEATHERLRYWDWSPAIVDFDLLLSYLRLVRAKRTVAHTLILTSTSDASAAATESHASYDLHADLEEGARPLWLRDGGAAGRRRPRRRRDTPVTWLESVVTSESTLRQQYGKALRWVMVNALGWSLPAWEELGDEWFGLFAPHVTRALWTTYWRGVRGENGPARPTPTGMQFESGTKIAMRASNDELATLDAVYDATTATMERRQQKNEMDWLHPVIYDAWMDRVHWLTPIDWAREWTAPEFPLPPKLAARRDARLPPAGPRRRGRPRKVALASAVAPVVEVSGGRRGGARPTRRAVSDSGGHG